MKRKILLERVYLMNILLYCDSITTIKTLLCVNKKCQETIHSIRINPFNINFKEISKNKHIFTNLETIYELKDLEEVEEFKRSWNNKITFIRTIQSCAIFYSFIKPFNTNQIELLSKIEEYSITRLTLHCIDEFMYSIPFFFHLKKLKIGYSSYFNFNKLNQLKNLKTVYVLFQFRFPETIIYDFHNVDIQRTKYHFILYSIYDEDILQFQIYTIQHEYPSIQIHIALLTRKVEQYFHYFDSCYVDPNYFKEEEYETINNSLPCNIKIFSKKIQDIKHINLKDCYYLKNLSITLKNKDSFELVFPQSLKILSIEAPQAKFNLNNIPIECLNLTRIQSNWHSILTTLTSLSLYQCKDFEIDLAHSKLLKKIGVCCCSEISIITPITIPLCGIYFSTKIKINFTDNYIDTPLFIYDVIHFWCSQTKKMIVEINTDTLDLFMFNLQYISFYDCSIKFIKLPMSLHFVRVVNSRFKFLEFNNLIKLTIQSHSIIEKIKGNYISRIHLSGTINNWNIQNIGTISYHNGILSEEIKCKRVIVKTKKRYIDLHHINSNYVIFSSKSKTNIACLNKEVIHIIKNSLPVVILNLNNFIPSKQFYNEVFYQVSNVILSNIIQTTLRIVGKKIKNIDLSHCSISKLIIRRCQFIENILLPFQCQSIYIEKCPNIHKIRYIEQN
ncbi:hypothetical protein EDI_088650 [Entamoeba dispar SAW760]|uniref:Uncharacterized protein n=1 Tax=Entamoeba dispar (strain ATCC PRA-260 / SAW760) TaxID=370354 RepID=B0EG08_ENTDS|nr:uncharacterized protein EDI_088650 [Entamoeba dispar SAW760]EDR26535.1 hypothetical protein EDI_088650 [Entamoeba dispar SAW760]|eukprot:EDR26535.1 hypothetical protein EDI_088650 [Entamoeba dispar SAW760]